MRRFLLGIALALGLSGPALAIAYNIYNRHSGQYMVTKAYVRGTKTVVW